MIALFASTILARFRSCKLSTILPAFVVIGILTTGFMIVSGRAAGPGFPWPASITAGVSGGSSLTSPTLAAAVCVPPSTVYVDDDWSGVILGTDPDAGGPATNFGCDSFATIQTGIDGVTSGGTVIVYAGTYTLAASISLNKSIVLQGPNSAISPNGGARVAEALITGSPSTALRISSPGNPVTIEGFKFDSAGVVDAYDPALNITIRRNIFSNGISGGALYFLNAPTLLTIDDNHLTNAVLPDNDTVFVAGNWNGTTGTVVSITNNVIDNTPSANAPGMNLSNVSGAITGNQFTNLLYYAILLANNSSSITISGNVFDGIVNPDPIGVPNWGAGVRFYTPAYSGPVNIKSNTFKNSYVGVGVRASGGDLTGMDIHVNFNRFVGNTFGIRHDGSGPLEAQNNWWGCNFGPGTGGAGCTGTPNGLSFAGGATIDASTWLLLRTIAAPSSIVQFTNSTITADMRQNSAAVDTSGSGTVELTPVAFSASEGTMAPPTGTITAGQAMSTFTSTSTNNATACSTVDGQQICTPITVTPPCVTPATVYVDDSWVGTTPGTDPDAGGPATNFGCDSFATIQNGVAAVPTGGTVMVYAGTYNGPQILVNRSMSVLGAGALTTIIDGLGAAPPTTGLVRLESPLGDTGNTIFSGFTVQNAGTGSGSKFGIFAKPLDPLSTATILNNKIIGTNLGDGALYVDRNRGPVVFHHNEITNTAGNAVLIEKPLNSTDVHHNTITASGTSSAYFAMTYDSQDITTLQRVADNTFNSPTAGAITFNTSPTFVSGPSRFGKYTNVQITDNVITLLAAARSGIVLLNDTTDATGALGAIENPVITGNRIIGTDAATSNGIRFRGLVTNASVKSNDIRDVARGFFGEIFNATHSATGTELHFNDIVSNASGVTWNGPVSLNAENNWWGCNAGPGNAGCDTVTGVADFNPWLVLGVSASPNPILPGGNSTVTADMRINSDAVNTSASGTLPLTPVAWSATQGTMAPPTGTITAGLASSTFTSNSASSGTGCATVDNQLKCTDITVLTFANVSGTKTKSGGNTPGSNITYTVVLSNSGGVAQADNPGNEFTDTLPSSLSLVSVSSTSGTAAVAANTATWNGSISAGGSVTITINATINSGTALQVVSNQGTINYDSDNNATNDATRMTDDPAVGGASDPTNFTVVSPANVSGTKTKAGGNNPGQTVTYTVVLSNSSSSAQLDNPGNEFTDTLPAGLTLVSASATSGTAAANVGTNTVNWNGSIAGNGSVTITITATINNVPDGTIVSNQGTISYDADGNGTNESSRMTDDPAVGGASDPTSFAVVSKSDLTITKTHSGNFSGGQVGASYTITVNNIGTGVTSGLVTVTDTVPVGLTPTGPNGVVNGWTCSINGQTLTCTRSDVLAGGSSYPPITLTVNVANPAPLNVVNTATVAGGGEVNTANNTTSDPTAINCSANFALNNTSPLVISRFRENGPAGPQDEFVEIYNPSPLAHTVASGNCNGGGYGVYASAGNGTTSDTATLVCYIPNGTVIPAGGYYLCTGVTYSLNNLGLNGGAAGATATGDAPIGCGGTCGTNIPDDAGLVLINKAAPTVTTPEGFGAVEFGEVVFDKVGFGPYGPAAPAPGYPALSPSYCEGGATGCLKPVGDASTGAACTNPTGQFPVVSAPPACYGLAGQYEFLRRQTTFSTTDGTIHQDTNNNGDDFILVAPNPATNMGQTITGVAGVTAVLGAAGPYNRNAPPDMPAVKLTRSPFDGTNQFGPLNAERRFIPDPTIADPANNPLGTYTLRFRFTNNSGLPINGLRFEVDNLSTLCGPQVAAPTTASVATGDARNVGSTPGCGTGSFTAIFKALNSTAETVVDSGGAAQFVNGTVMEDLSVGAAPGAGPLSPKGGGMDSTYIINPSSNAASVGDGVTGGIGNFATVIGTTDPAKVLRVRVKFGVVRSGRFILLLVPMARNSPAP